MKKTVLFVLLVSALAANAALEDIAPVPIGPMMFIPGTATTYDHVLDGQWDAVALAFKAPKAGSIVGMRVCLHSVTGTGTTYRFALEGVKATDIPDGTVKGGGSPASDSVLNESLAGDSVNTITFDNAYTATAGESLCATVRYVSGTVASNYITVRYGLNHITEYFTNPSMLLQTAGTDADTGWADQVSSGFMIAAEYSDGTLTYPYASANDGIDIASGWTSSSSATTSLWRGTYWTPQFTCRMIGAYVCYRNAGSYGLTGSVYSGADEELATTTLSSDDLQSTASGTLVFIPFEPMTMTADTVYRLVMKPDTTSEFTDVIGIKYDTVAHRQIMYPTMLYTQSSTVASGEPTAWDDTSANGPILIPVIDQIDLSAGGGGGGGRSAGANLNGELQ